jgi:peptidoglycan/LPS O-acetylase OafA/YrhL
VSSRTPIGVRPPPRRPDRAPAVRQGIGYVPALDGVRALAVLAVLAFHGGMPWAGGGFLGVDAFFVLSGYLITSLLLAEWERTGRIALGSFWARRARRLLPALLLMVVVVTLGGRVLLPPEEVRLLRGDGLAALFYVANWRMILRGGDYFAQTASPSPLEHTWSLGIEEQFYLAWPLVMAALLAGTVVVGARRTGLRRLLLLCVLGAAVSTGLLAAMYRSDDPGRAYYGTDTRGTSLLVGAALAVALALRRPTGAGPGVEPLSSRRARLVLGALAAIAVLGLAGAWTRASGGDAELYRGGLALVALAVAILLAHVVLVPRGWSAWLLSWVPLVLVGRISYGIYLWHWPVFLALNADRTGRVGFELFGWRCLATFAVAVLSYVLIERPIRAGGVLRRHRGAINAAGAVAAVVTVAVLVLVSTGMVAARNADPGLTGVQRLGAPDGIDEIGPAAPEDGHPERVRPKAADRPRPADRPARGRPANVAHRHPLPGRDPVIAVFGDSVAWTLVTYLPSHPGLDIRNRTLMACGVARVGPYRYFGETYPGVGPDCRNWPQLWRRAISTDDPDVAVILAGRWETMDRMYDGRWRSIGDPAFDAYLRSELELAIATAVAHGARVVLATEPYNRRGENLDGSLYPEDEPERVTAWNRLLRDVAADSPGVRLLDFGARVSPEGHFTWTAGGVQVRSDGLHLTPSGVQQWIAPWLLPWLRDAVTR